MTKQWNVALVVPSTHPCLAGHFPGRPIAPAVVLLDLVFAAIQSAISEPLRIVTISHAKFLHPVMPEQPVELSIAIEPQSADRSVRARFHASREHEVVFEGAFVLAAGTTP